MMDLSHKKIGIIGMGRTGMAAAEVLSKMGAVVTLHDQKNASDLAKAIAKADGWGVSCKVGDSAYSDLNLMDLIVASPGMRKDHPVLTEARRQGVQVVSEIEMAYRISPAPIIAITGTNGKTTTTALIGAVLNSCGRHALVGGNIAPGIPLITQVSKASKDDVVVAEVSTFQLEQIDQFRPKVGVLTNISADHLDRHKDLDTYAALKASLFKNQTSDDFAVLNLDNAKVMEATAEISSTRLYFSRKQEPEEGAFLRGEELILRFHGKETHVCTRESIRLRGDHNVENALATLAAVAPFGINLDQVPMAFSEFKEIEHRMERVTTLQGVEFINNSMCTNMDAAVRSLQAMEKPTILIAGGKDKGSDFTLLGKTIAQKAKFLILIGVDGTKIGDAANQSGFDRICEAKDLAESVELAFSKAENGDAVMLSPGCASFDMFKDFEDRGLQFKKAVLNLKARLDTDQKS